MKVYKVCRVEEGNWVSYQVHDIPRLVVKYALNKTTKPKVGLLFAFKTINDAKSWCSDDGVILECEGTVEKRLLRGRANFCAPNDIAKRMFMPLMKTWWNWFLYGNGVPEKIKPFYRGWSCPEGTFLCSEITPIKEL